jgi:hypothetical protein
MKEVFSLVGVAFAVAGNIHYVRQIDRGVEPHPYTWALGTLVTAITLVGIVLKGGGAGAWPVAVSLCFTAAIFFYSLRYGIKHIVPLDTALLVVALVGLVPWFITKDPTLSVAIAVMVDTLSFVPTIRKTWRHPHTEVPVLYATNVARHALILLSLEAYVLATTLHSVVMIVVNILMVALIVWRRGKL